MQRAVMCVMVALLSLSTAQATEKSKDIVGYKGFEMGRTWTSFDWSTWEKYKDGSCARNMKLDFGTGEQRVGVAVFPATNRLGLGVVGATVLVWDAGTNHAPLKEQQALFALLRETLLAKYDKSLIEVDNADLLTLRDSAGDEILLGISGGNISMGYTSHAWRAERQAKAQAERDKL